MKIMRNLINKTKIIAILASISFLAASCSYANWYKPHGYTFKQVPKDGTPGLKLGWKHGCESGFSTQFGGTFYMTFYGWKRDPELLTKNPDINKLKVKYQKELPINWDNPQEVKKNLSDYRKIFWNTHNFCRHSALGTHHNSGTLAQDGKWEPPLAGQMRYAPMDLGKSKSHTIGNVWSFQGRGNSHLTYW